MKWNAEESNLTMAKIKVIIDVPNETCKGCQFYSSHYTENHYSHEEWYTCKLFDCKINDAQRCIACKSLEVEQ